MDALILFTQIAEIIIIAAIVSGILKYFKQPTLLAYILAGILLGPLVLGSFNFHPFGGSVELGINEITPEIKLLSLLGMAFLLFSVGIETSMKRVLQVGKPVFIGTILQVIMVIAVTLLLTVPFHLLTIEQALFVGTIISFSSTMIVVKILSDKGEINTLTGRMLISVLILQDILVLFFVPVLANIGMITDFSFIIGILAKSVLLILVGLFLNRFVFPRLFAIAADEQELFLLSSIATAFFFIGLSELLNIPIPIGAFVGGLALSTLPYNLEIFAKVRALRDFFLTIFFVSLGIQLNFSFGNVPIALMAIIIALIFIIKPLILFVFALFAGYGSRIGIRLGLSLAQVSEFGFELAGIGLITMSTLGTPIFSKELFSFLIAIIAVSMILTPYMMHISQRLANYFLSLLTTRFKFLRHKFFNRKLDELEHIPSKKALKDHIIIIGGGTVGRGLAKALNATHQLIVVDYDPEVVKQGQSDGLPYVYGSTENDALWKKLDLPDAKLLVITIPRHKEAIRILELVKKSCPTIKVFAISNYFAHTLEFYRKGVDFVSMPIVMGSNIFLENISTFVETGKLFFVQNYFTEYLRYLEEQTKEENKYHKRRS